MAAVYFDKLFEMISEADITQTELMQRIGASSSTMTKMRNNQIVSLEVIVRVCEELNCDIGDIVSCKPDDSKVDVGNDKLNELNALSRSVLNDYLKKSNLSPRDVAEQTGLSLNTVKSFLNGNNISSVSHTKLLRLGDEYNTALGRAFKAISSPEPEKKIYCYSCGKRRNHCWAAQSLWKPEEKVYERYCAFGFKQAFDEDGKLYAAESCPHPTTGKEFAWARERYDYTLKCEHIYIPAKGEQ
ncbi:MAG: helix-turn-helix domain-containing protein [Clostridiales bacterium]|nr:helix-turn-helix domain-containing protein [Clostridiales bacterium]